MLTQKRNLLVFWPNGKDQSYKETHSYFDMFVKNNYHGANINKFQILSIY